MRYYEIMSEMAMPDASLRAGVFWHGTRDEAAAKSIMQHGLDPDATKIKYGDKQSEGRPIAGQVYVSPQVSYSLAYSGYGGFMFEIPGDRLVDIYPDEDSLGELVGFSYGISQGTDDAEPPFDEKASKALLQIARKFVTLKAIQQCAEGHTGYHTKVGKKIAEHVPDWLRVICANFGHIGHAGRLMPAQCWRVPPRQKDSPWFIPEDEFFAGRTLIWQDQSSNE